jgi:hypothetical protein
MEELLNELTRYSNRNFPSFKDVGCKLCFFGDGSGDVIKPASEEGEWIFSFDSPQEALEMLRNNVV